MKTITALIVAGVLAGCSTSPTWLGGCELTQGEASGLWYTPVDSAECREAVNWANENPTSDVENFLGALIGYGAWIGGGILAN